MLNQYPHISWCDLFAIRRLSKARLALALLVLMLRVDCVLASEQAQLIELKHTILNLVDGLVDNHVLTAEQAASLKQTALAKAKQQTAQELAEQAAAQADVSQAASVAGSEDAQGQRVVRVPYVPEFVKNQIRQEVKAELREEVMADVAAKAKTEKWGSPEALPDWVNRLHWSGDLRLRFQTDHFGERNQPRSYFDYAAINDANGLSGPDSFLNLTEDREALRVRLRLGLLASLSDQLTLGVQLATGRDDNPVSTNQTMGTNFDHYAIAVDRVFLHWAESDPEGHERVAVSGGKIANPFLTTPLVWDPDLSFDGLAGSLGHRFAWGDLLGSSRRDMGLAVVLGGFAVSNGDSALDDHASNDKWLLGAQLVFDHAPAADTHYQLGLAYYDYINETGKFNPQAPLGSTLYDWTAPGFLQRGNTLYPIKLDSNGNPTLYGLAAHYALLDLVGKLTLAQFDPIAVVLTANAVRNVAYDTSAVRALLGGDVEQGRDGLYLQMDIGWLNLDHFGAWNVSATYRYLERDAVLDAFTDSEFALGGTDSQGWSLSGELGLTKATSIALRYMSSNEIDLAPLSIDILQFDVNARF